MRVAGRKRLGAFNPKDVLPSSRSYYFYKGSFTTPPCTEGVNWVVLRQYATVTRRQAAAFPFTKNYRPAQPLNGPLMTINGLKKAHSGGHSWGYRSENGLRKCSKKYSKCAGRQQSPIDIRSRNSKTAKSSTPSVRFRCASSAVDCGSSTTATRSKCKAAASAAIGLC